MVRSNANDKENETKEIYKSFDKPKQCLSIDEFDFQYIYKLIQIICYFENC